MRAGPDQASIWIKGELLLEFLPRHNSNAYIPAPCEKSEMKPTPTPDWNEHDLKLCRQYDEKVKQGVMKYKTVEVK